MVFVRDLEGLEKFFRSLKSTCCPFCEQTGSLNRHGRMYGNDPTANEGRIARGHRVFCSDRGKRGGCGRTFPVMFAWALPRHTFTATLVWQAALKWLEGASIRAAWLATKTPMALDSFYHILQRLRNRLTVIRTILSAAARPARNSKHPDVLLQTFEHLRRVFPEASCPISAFQEHFQKPLTG